MPEPSFLGRLDQQFTSMLRRVAGDAQINDFLIGHALKNTIRRHDQDLIIRGEFAGEHFGFGHDANLLGNGIAQGPRKGCSGIILAMHPNPGWITDQTTRRVATSIHVLQLVVVVTVGKEHIGVTPIFVHFFQPFHLIHAHNGCPAQF